MGMQLLKKLIRKLSATWLAFQITPSGSDHFIRSSVFRNAKITDPKDQQFDEDRDISKEVKKIRVLIRGSKYLASPFQFCKHTDIAQTLELSERLVNFVEIAENNCGSYLRHVLKGEEYKINVVYTTKEEQVESEST